MRKVMLTAWWTLLMSASAFAADLSPAPMYAAPSLAPWTGFYVGANAGGGIGNAVSDFSVAGTTFASVDNSLTGAVAGGQLGYNWQTGPMVLGLEADIQFSSAKGTLSAPCVPGLCGVALTANYSQEISWFGTVRGRVGYAMGYGGRWMPYITGGLAYGDNNISFPGVGETKTQVGWTVGAGLEWAFWDRWSAKLEYLYMDLGEGPTVAVTPAFTITTDHLTDNIARVGVNYRF